MKKLLLLSVLGFVFGGVAFAQPVSQANIQVEVPSTFALKVGESAMVKNYQNLNISLSSILVVNSDCDSKLTPCPLGNPVNMSNPQKSVKLVLTTPGGCGENADSRCLGGPAYSNSVIVKEGSFANALGVKVAVVSVGENSATLSISMKTEVTEDNKDTDKELHPHPPVPVVKVGTVTQGTIKAMDKIIICPNGEASTNCSVCAKGECSPAKDNTTSSNSKVLRVSEKEEVVSVVDIKEDKEEGVKPGFEVKTVKKGRILFLFPVNAEIKYTVDAKTGSSTVSSRPWWSFLAW